ncbi:RING/U-box superfamily protein [Actinidia rufa]|uniref:RING/U-box superfamily protein n=1 Tax=Actinidia rufa TaxID=165716 RepID=A0A7J0DS71_9ERIC|nr:RING/U-box superfamily protein [Actinidia rufa]
MAYSYSSSLITTFLLLSLLHLSSFHNFLAAKHSHHTSSSALHHQHHRLSPSPAPNPRLHQAYIALQAWKRVIYSDPKNFTTNWVGPSVCHYTGVYCAPLPNATTTTTTVAGIDLNLGDIAGFLPNELGLLSDLALLHLNSNRFCGLIPQTLSNMKPPLRARPQQQQICRPFPKCCPLPPFSPVPRYPSASVLVFANNNFDSCLPPSIANLADTLEELVLINTNLSGCLPQEVGFLYKLRLLDVSSNKVEGPIPYSIAGLAHLEQLNLAHNRFSGIVPEGGIAYNDSRNCLPEKPLQRRKKECDAAAEHPVDCYSYHCGGGGASVPLYSPPSHGEEGDLWAKLVAKAAMFASQSSNESRDQDLKIRSDGELLPSLSSTPKYQKREFPHDTLKGKERNALQLQQEVLELYNETECCLEELVVVEMYARMEVDVKQAT